MTGKRDYP